ncbi:13512_t:CDS:2 [Entrophospora sp. SA101]|nr:13512_t:CDS:2 [Entrophospora sp. SA101]
MQSNKVEITDKILDPKMIEAMDRKELQAHCKKFGYKANLKNEKLKEMLLHRTMRQIGIGIEEGDYNASDILQRSFKRYCELQQQQKIELTEVAEEYLTLGETVKETEPAAKLLTIDAKEYLSLGEKIKEIETALTSLPNTGESPSKLIGTNDNDAENTNTADNNDENGYNNNNKIFDNNIATANIDTFSSSNNDSDAMSRPVTMVDIENKFTELYNVVIQEDLHKLAQFSKKTNNIHQNNITATATTNTSANNVNSVDHVAAIRPTKRKKNEPIESTSTSSKKQRITITRTTTKAVGKKPVAKRKIVVKNDEQKKKEEFLQRREASRNG